MKDIWNKAAAVLAFVIGAMAVFAGGKVLLGQDPGYYVIDWVPVYNFTAGVITVLVGTVLIWKNSRYALPVALVTLLGHSLVMAILQTAYRQVVAPESLQAMTIRIAAWSVILGLLLVRAWRYGTLRARRAR